MLDAIVNTYCTASVSLTLFGSRRRSIVQADGPKPLYRDITFCGGRFCSGRRVRVASVPPAVHGQHNDRQQKPSHVDRSDVAACTYYYRGDNNCNNIIIVVNERKHTRTLTYCDVLSCNLTIKYDNIIMLYGQVTRREAKKHTEHTQVPI